MKPLGRVQGYHSDPTLAALEELEVRSYISEPERGPRRWQDKRTGKTPPAKRAAQKALYGFQPARAGRRPAQRVPRRRPDVMVIGVFLRSSWFG